MPHSKDVFRLPESVRLVIFDADGTLRRTTVDGKPCPHEPCEWELLPNVRETLRALGRRKVSIHLGVASNQDQVAYGHLTEKMAYRLLSEMFFEAVGREPEDGAIRICPHALEVVCKCRKPAPGMLIDIMRKFGTAPAQTLFVGDAETDREAAQRAGTAL
jgi:D-glycero-D-manno-heptose 1,7-bisphosphate phosphatase